MPSFEEQAEKLAALYTERALLNRRVYDHEQAVQKRQAALTPADGWPGKNDEARKAAREAAFAADDELAQRAASLSEARGKLILLAGDVDAAEAERRAAEWQVRADLLQALARGGVQPNHRGERTENAFDDVSQAALDLGATEAAAELPGAPEQDGFDLGLQPEPAGAPAEDDWPF